MQFFASAVTTLQTLVVALGAGLAVWGVVNLLEGYGSDNAAAKSQGIKQLMAGGGVVLIGTGTFLMLEKRSPAAGCAPQCGSWMLYAFGSAVFASLTAILGKAGIQGVESNLGTAIRTGVVLVMAWLMVLVTGKAGAVRQVPRRELAFICLSGVATGASWLCYYRALQSGPASVVVPIDKLSILVTVAFSRLVFRERLTSRSAAGLALIVAGTLAMLF